MVDEHAFWAEIDALDDGLAPPPGCVGQRDVLTERLCTDGGPALAGQREPFEVNPAVLAFISACIFAGAMSAAFVFQSPLERLIMR